ncbi:MAG: ribose 5-phosphate isomerase B [Chloroflexota bacterium]|nr:ribose 5-phosphate isomerase B [Chloroflexota bacterium]
MTTQIVFGCDHRGLELKQDLVSLIRNMGYSYDDLGCYSTFSVDYPDIAYSVAKAVAESGCAIGVLICSTGIGMSMSANKVNGIRAALCHSIFTAQKARQHNNANIVCIGADVLGRELAREIVTTFLETHFEGGRHSLRIKKLMGLEHHPTTE